MVKRPISPLGENFMDLTQIRSIRISKHDLMDIVSDGTHSKKLENGVVLTITIDKGKMVKHEAKDKAGNSLQTFFLTMWTGPLDEGRHCYVCWPGGGGYEEPPYCVRRPCDI
jgi:hypothetical protein